MRPEAHQERFTFVHGRGWCSDAWGAACEAVSPKVAGLNWQPKDRFKFESAMQSLRGVQQKYFADYWQMPALCPGSQQRFIKAGGKILKGGILDLYRSGVKDIGAITSECDKVKQMAGMVDHLFYAHGMTREAVADCVAAYEEMRNKAAIVQNFEHVQDPSLQQRIHERVSREQVASVFKRHGISNHQVN